MVNDVIKYLFYYVFVTCSMIQIKITKYTKKNKIIIPNCTTTLGVEVLSKRCKFDCILQQGFSHSHKSQYRSKKYLCFFWFCCICIVEAKNVFFFCFVYLHVKNISFGILLCCIFVKCTEYRKKILFKPEAIIKKSRVRSPRINVILYIFKIKYMYVLGVGEIIYLLKLQLFFLYFFKWNSKDFDSWNVVF